MNEDARKWAVIDRDGSVIFRFYSEERATDEAAVLNGTGLPEFAPYSVVEQ